jgi:LCP family protein required for cell wall assembly
VLFAALGVGLCVVAWWLYQPVQAQELRVDGALEPRPKLISQPVAAAAGTRSPSVAPIGSIPLTPPALPPEKAALRLPAGAHTTLLVGIDRRPDAKGAGLADTILVAILDETQQMAGVVSIPRDLWVTIPDYGENRINVIPMVARAQKKPLLELFSRVIEDTLGLPVAHGIFVDLGVFERVVDAVGGVDVAVPCPIIDSFHDTRVPGGRRRLDLAEGQALLDGPTAAMYVRSRHGRSDFGRARRQQAVLLGLRDRVLSLGGFVRVPELYSAVEESISTDLRRYELVDLARRVLALDRDELHGLVLSPPLTRAHATDDGKAVLLPDRDAITEAILALPKAGPPGEPLKVPCPPADAALRGR